VEERPAEKGHLSNIRDGEGYVGSSFSLASVFLLLVHISIRQRLERGIFIGISNDRIRFFFVNNDILIR
jgi:hypothetical protein